MAQELPPEPELAVDTETLATIEESEGNKRDEREEIVEPSTPEMMNHLSVTVDNFDEWAFEQEEKAYFDYKQDQALLANYETPMNAMDQSEIDFRSLEESEKLFFNSMREQENEKEDIKTAFN